MNKVSILAVLALAATLGACIIAGTPPPAPPPASQPPTGQPPVVTPPPTSAECTPADCGPAMGMPNSRCVDGSMAGPTGRCLRQSHGRCGWEVRQCPPVAAGCVRTGCSGSVCAERGQDVFTTCDMRPEYECYAAARCERQANGACGFTATAALSQCLATKSGKQ